MGADLFESYCGSILATMVLGSITEYYTGTDTKPGALDRRAVADRLGHQHHRRPRHRHGLDRAADPRARRSASSAPTTSPASTASRIAAVGMLSTTGIQLAIDAYGPISDNAGGIAEMGGLGSGGPRAHRQALDAVGNTTAAIGKGFAIGSAALTAWPCSPPSTPPGKLPTRTQTVAKLLIESPMVMAALFVGGMLPFLFSR
jgi:K(+)-stimulated pyrophosphate-energized sodium pump